MTDPIREAHRLTIMGLRAMIPDEIPGADDRTSSANLHWMLDQCLDELETFPVDKLGRWVGFVQGVLALSGCMDVDAERDRTRPFFHNAYTKSNLVIPKTLER